MSSLRRTVYRELSSFSAMTINREKTKTTENNYSTGINYTLHYTRWFLTILGLWPMVSSDSTKSQYNVSKLLITINCSLIGFTTLPCLSHMIFRKMDPITRLMLVGPITFCIASILKYSSIIYRRRTIRRCIKHIEIDWKSIECDGDWKIMMKNVKVGRDLTVVCGIFLFCCTLCYYVILPLWSGKIVITDCNETLRMPILYGYDVLLDAQKSPAYEFIFYTRCVGAFVNSTVALTSCSIAAIFVTHACGQFEIVVSRLENLLEPTSNDDKGDYIQRRIKFIVSTHVRVLEFTSKIDEALREISCVEVASSTLTLCLDEYYCLTEWNRSEALAIFTYVGIFISLIFNIFLFCHIGELLKGQCVKIEEAAYMSDWYKLPGRTGLAIVLIIGTGLQPRKIKAGRVLELSFLTFSSIIKTTLAYFNTLRMIGF